MLLSLPVVILLIPQLVHGKSAIPSSSIVSLLDFETTLPSLVSRSIIDQLQQGIQSLGNGVQNFFGTPSSLLDDTTAEQEGVKNALGRE